MLKLLRLLLPDAIPEFLRFIRFEKRMSAHTLTAYRGDLEQFRAYLDVQFGLEEVGAVRYVHIRSWLAQQKDGDMSERTLQRKIASVRSLFRYLMRIGVIPQNPARQVRAPKAPVRLPAFLEEQQTDTLMAETVFPPGFEGDTERLILELLYQTGMRRSELVQLKDSDVDFGSRQIRVLGKRNKERLIPVGAQLIATIREYTADKRKMFGHQSPFLLSLKSGAPVYAGYVYRVVKKHLASVTTLSRKSPHVLRHTFATQLTNNGADLNAVKELLGHSSLAATQVYTHTNIERLKEVYRKAHPKS